MSNEFQFKILNDKIVSLSKEKGQLVHDLTTTERNEQAELDRVRKEFNIRTSNIRSRQLVVDSDLLNQKRNLESLERRLMIEQDKKDFELAQRKADEEMRRRLR